MRSPEHFESIVSAHYESLYRFALSLTRSDSDAGDLTQETFYRWAQKGHQLRDASKVKGWLFTTLHRLYLSSRRGAMHFPHHLLEDVEQELPICVTSMSDRLDSSEVVSALGRVNDIYRASLALFYLEDYTYHEIAAILEIPVGTIKSRISRGILQLRSIFLDREPCTSSYKHNPPSHEAGPVVPVIRWNGALSCAS